MMADNKKYYYMRLKEDFFNSEEIMVLESMQDGYLYSNILLKMYLCSLKTDGRLMLNNIIPYNAKMIATVTRHSVGTVEKALDIFERLGLIEVLDNGAIYMMNIQNYIGKSSTEAERIKDYRARIKDEKIKSVQMYDKCTPEIDIDTDIDIDIEKDIDIERESEREKKKTKKKNIEPKHRYGEYNNVLLTDNEYQKLQNEVPNYQEWIQRCSEYVASTGRAYKSHYAAIKAWIRKEKNEKVKPSKRSQEFTSELAQIASWAERSEGHDQTGIW